MEHTYEHSCVECGKSFSNASNLYRHARLIHNAGNIVTVSKQQLKCSLCKEGFPSKKALEEHFMSYHDIAIERELMEFDTFEEFLVWKGKVESENTCMYVKKTGTKVSSSGVGISYFQCHRSGSFSCRGQGKRNVKILGSNKIDAICPSLIKVIQKGNDGNVMVEFTKTHVGHNMDIGRMRISDVEKKGIAEKLRKKIPIDAILDEIRDSVTDKLERIHLLTHKDVLNIKSEFNISHDGILDTSDELSVSKWVESLRDCEDSPIILYKEQNVNDELFPGLKKEDFLLVIMNKSQKDVLKMYGDDVVCLDFTHGMNAHGFDLATVVILDDKREGFPAAFILSNRQDSTALTLAFKAIEEHVKISPKVLMTDDAESFHTAWKNVFGNPVKRLLCSWHVDRSWRRKVSLISSQEKQTEVYKILRCLLSETDEEAFKIMLTEALKFFENNEDLQEFGKYFENTYSRRPEAWAYCYRKWSGVNTNMHIERMHRTLKYIYLQGKKVKRLDKTLFCLMKYVRDKVFDRLICIEKGKVSAKIAQIRNRHKASQTLEENLCHEEIKESRWCVSSATKSGEVYTVERNIECSKNCTLICKDCNHCLHNFTCTCLDNSIQWNMCKHIHLVCGKYLKSSETLESFSDGSQDEDMHICEDSKREEREAHIRNLKKTVCGTSKEKYEADFLKVMNEATSIGLKATTSKEREEIMKIMKNTLNSIKACHEAHKNPEEQHFASTSKEPPNKKIKPQRFVSTKKKPGTHKSFVLEKPSQEESIKIAMNLIMKSKQE